MKSIGSAASTLGVVPKIQVHEITKPSIALSLYTLREASISHAIFSAVDVLKHTEFSSEGPAEARTCLQNIAPDVLAAIPSVLVSKLRTLARDAEVTPTAAAAAAGAASSDRPERLVARSKGSSGSWKGGVKRELDRSS